MSTPTVVSIHDESEDIAKLKQELLMAGYQVVESGRRASDFCSIQQLHEIGVILVDYSFQQLQLVVENVTKHLPNIPIIWLSEDVCEDSVVKVEGVEVISLRKPLSTQALIRVIAYCTKSSQFSKSLHMVHVATQEVAELVKRKLGAGHEHKSCKTYR